MMLVHTAATYCSSFPHISGTTTTLALRQLRGDTALNCALWWETFLNHDGHGLVVDVQ